MSAQLCNLYLFCAMGKMPPFPQEFHFARLEIFKNRLRSFAKILRLGWAASIAINVFSMKRSMTLGGKGREGRGLLNVHATTAIGSASNDLCSYRGAKDLQLKGKSERREVREWGILYFFCHLQEIAAMFGPRMKVGG